MILGQRVSFFAALAALLAAACGGKVAVDQHGAGGTSTATTTGAGGGGCESLGAALAAAVGAAQACSPVVGAVQCSGKTVVHDACGCPIVANDMQPDAAAAAEDAFAAWVASGCGPIECFACPPSPDSTPWDCPPGTMKCSPVTPD
jgi:hypothetical protein